MKLKKENLTLINDNIITDFSAEDMGDDHIYTGLETPMKSDAFEISDLEKKEKICETRHDSTVYAKTVSANSVIQY